MTSSPLTFIGRPAAERSWLLLGLTGAALAAVVNTAIFAVYLLVTGVPLRASMIAAVPPQPLTVPQIVLASALPALLAALLAAALTRWTTEPRRWFLGIGVIVGLTSILGPLNQPGAGGNQLVLALMHVAAAIAIVSSILPKVPAARD